MPQPRVVSTCLRLISIVVHVVCKESAVGDCRYGPTGIHFAGLPHPINRNDRLAAAGWAGDNHGVCHGRTNWCFLLCRELLLSWEFHRLGIICLNVSEKPLDTTMHGASIADEQRSVEHCIEARA